MKDYKSLILLPLIFLISACDLSSLKWDLPKLAVVETLTPDKILNVSAHIGGNISNDGGSSVQQRGVCYATKTNPTIADSTLECGSGTGTYDANLQGLTAATTYYLKAFATTSAGTAYGNEVVFTTLSLVTLATSAVSSITLSTAICGGSISNAGGATITERGICYDTSKNPTTSNSVIKSGSGTGDFSVALSGLSSNKTYYVRAYAINVIGTSYGNEVSFTTASLPTITTATASLVTQTSARCGGDVLNQGSSTVSQRGVCYDIRSNPTIDNNIVASGTGGGVFTASLTGLTPGTTYFVRAYATNASGIIYGNEVTFLTNPVLVPTVSTTAVSLILTTTATSGGNVTNDGSGTVVSRGICYSTSHNPTLLSDFVESGSGTGNFIATINGLNPGTTYYVKAFASNSAGTAYGNEVSFSTAQQLKIGLNYQGGIIFYLEGTNLHGMIAAPSDQSSGATWGCSGTSIPGSALSSIGTGLSNSTAIVTDCTSTGIAAKLCLDLVTGGYTDWYLPSSEELSLMYNNLKVQNLGGFSNSNYWSSTESSATNSLLQSFQNGTISAGLKNTTGRVRAIRTF
jgi:hypothetical protein